jgi:hypothetical protein
LLLSQPRFQRINRPIDVKLAHAPGCDVGLGFSDQRLQLFEAALAFFECIKRFAEHIVLAAKPTRGDLGLYASFKIRGDWVGHGLIIVATWARIKLVLLVTVSLERHCWARRLGRGHGTLGNLYGNSNTYGCFS